MASGELWEVVGGAERGGIVVRESRDLGSPQLPSRLSAGSLVRAVEYNDASGRLHYELLDGAGPASGWVTTRLAGKALVARSTRRPPSEAAPAASPAPQTAPVALPAPQAVPAAPPAPQAPAVQRAVSGGHPQPAARSQEASTPSVVKARAVVTPGRLPLRGKVWRSQPLSEKKEHPPGRRLLMPQQSLKFASILAGPGGKEAPKRRRFQHLSAPKAPAQAPSALQAAKVPNRPAQQRSPLSSLLSALHRRPLSLGTTPGLLNPGFADKFAPSARPNQNFIVSRGLEKDSKEQEVQLCPRCLLPIGYWGYAADDDKYKEGSLLHGECKAQLILQKLVDEDAAKQREEAAERKKCREQYGIGWKAEQVPRGIDLAGKLQCAVGPQGTCCVVWQEDAHQIHLLPATDPATSVNLEYLALALQVRRKEGREPLFSLDPEDECRGAAFIKDMMQDKRFEPAWLAGTSAGDVMFQADYHLKELSMGAWEQPVVGLKSCFDHSEEEGDDSPWRAREWFVVKEASIVQTQDGVLIPSVEMGVEAREQSLGPYGREDARITRPDHPLVKYAERFSHYFDLIAERKSVIFHLRELAKACALAKFLFEEFQGQGKELDEAWFSLASEEEEPSADGLKIPQLWNERCFSKIQLRNGLIVDAEKGVGSSTHGVYGGVQFGLDRLPTVAPQRISAFARRTGLRAAASITASSQTVPFGWATGQPRGVDLNLDRFDLAEPTREKEEAPPGGWHREAESAISGNAFFEGLACESDGPFKKEDQELLKAVFNPILADRRAEGDSFIPPDARPEYASKLRALLAEEEEARAQRKKHFLSKEFSMDDAGPLFPSSWTASLAIARERAPWSCATSDEGRGPTRAEEGWIPAMLTTAAPLFDRSAEDGMRFRIYQVGSLEVRTCQAHGEEEVIGALFCSDKRENGAKKECAVSEDDKVLRVSEYVEFDRDRNHAYFVVMEVESGAVIVTEKWNGVTWRENPEDLQARMSLAKVTGCTDCSERRVTVGSMKAYFDIEKRMEQARRNCNVLRTTVAECRSYAQGAYSQALPAWERRWEQLTHEHRQAARDLGIRTPEKWHEGKDRVWSLPWSGLRDLQKEAAQVLGIDEASWGSWIKDSKEEEQQKGEEPSAKTGDSKGAEEEDDGVVVTRTCPKGHSLKRFVVDDLETEEDGGFECDGCDGLCLGGAVMYGCQRCDYDLCKKCAQLEPGVELPASKREEAESDEGETESGEGDGEEDEQSQHDGQEGGQEEDEEESEEEESEEEEEGGEGSEEEEGEEHPLDASEAVKGR